MNLTLIPLSLSILALAVSTCALFVALRTSARSLSKRLYELSASLNEQAEMSERLTTQLRNLRSRLNMQAYRARKVTGDQTDGEPSGEESPDSWKKRMNRQLALRGVPK